MSYLDPDKDPEELVFKDYPKIPDDKYPELGEECPRCRGRGGWNLKLDAYPNQQLPEHRHYRASCGACWGYGKLQKGQTCAHEWRNATYEESQRTSYTLYRCEHLWICDKCKQERVVDSSD
jgi:hypothetical protein